MSSDCGKLKGQGLFALSFLVPSCAFLFEGTGGHEKWEGKLSLSKLETVVEIKASAAKFHEMFTHKPHHISNASDRIIQACDLHEGDWGTVGSVVYWNYFYDGKAKVAKDLVEAIDAENNLITFKVIEGDLLEHYKSFKFTIHATPKGEGCNVHWTLEYEKHHHDDIEDPHTLLQLLVELSKDIDAHLTSTDA